jgi:hypothetical protein
MGFLLPYQLHFVWRIWGDRRWRDMPIRDCDNRIQIDSLSRLAMLCQTARVGLVTADADPSTLCSGGAML